MTSPRSPALGRTDLPACGEDGVSQWVCSYCGDREKHDRRRCRLKAAWRDPEFRARQAEATRRKWRDAEFRARIAETMRQKWMDCDFNPLAGLSPEERADYDRLKRIGYSRREALTAIRRADIARIA